MNKISVNKLSEYLGSDALRRRRIIEDQKEPVEFMITRYKAAKEAMINYIKSGYDVDIIDNAIDKLRRKTCSTDFEKNDRKTSIEALESFLEIKFPEHLLDFKISKPKKKINLVESKLQINVNPELIIDGVYRKKKVIGGIKIHISKHNKLTEEMQKNVSTLIHKAIEEKVVINSKKEVSHLDFCLSIDVFNRSIYYAPKSFKRRRKIINYACDEITLIWDSI
ncbi:hypothetical protein [Flavivirga jejuensis]|uniref:Uncharacterized protein n=1 Tax=Flavivirga jejuensis TaxID=870487 RepID=A0ABT8WRD4_9FLAO|nr:hypothetical protein [Flavivirga jejuensis]MDO5975705.1 hypothetical protein [Flavivirga jejuensis]